MTTQEFEKYIESIGGLENGWYPDREPIMKRYFFSVGDGWLEMIKELIERLIEAGWNKQIQQVKEKFGGLRFYIPNGSDKIYNLIIKYEKKSYSICEVCGEEGELKYDCGWEGRKWLKTMCDKHYIELKEERKNER